MLIEKVKGGIVYTEDGHINFKIEDAICQDSTVMMELNVNGNEQVAWLDPLTVRVMIEQLQKLQKLQEGV